MSPYNINEAKIYIDAVNKSGGANNITKTRIANVLTRTCFKTKNILNLRQARTYVNFAVKRNFLWQRKKLSSQTNNGRSWNLCFQNTCNRLKVVVSRGTIVKFLKGLSGFFAVEQDGKICRIGIHLQALAGGDCRSGKNKAFGLKSGVSSCLSWTNRTSLNGKKPLPMAVLPRQKKGLLCWKDQTRKRYEVDGGGRWQGSPYRCSSRFGLAE